ncbi:MAG: adenylate/guanylate cyclase domain-containing protein [Pseudomonadota bacterium]
MPHDQKAAELNSWMIRKGVLGLPHIDLLESYCRKLVELGVPLMRSHVTLNALHPVYGGVGFDWQHNEGPVRHEYHHQEQAPDDWLVSPFFHMLTNGIFELRERLCDMDEPSRFPLLNRMKTQGATDYLSAVLLFKEWTEGQALDLDDNHEGAMMSWMSHAPDGFSDQDIALIRVTFPTLCVVLRTYTNRRTAEDLLGIYLGRDAGHRVLSGEIRRGSSRWIDAVICYFDLEGFTSMSRQIEGEKLIAMLNDYFAVVVNRIEENGGNVLKFMGDGLLAIFDRQQFADAPHRAVAATRALDRDMIECSRARETAGLPTMGYTMALHAGPVLYGNIGADERLDFTVIGPEVNLAARIAGMHRSLGQHIIVSETVAGEVKDDTFDLISLGRYMLRGVDKPHELYTIYDAAKATGD